MIRKEKRLENRRFTEAKSMSEIGPFKLNLFTLEGVLFNSGDYLFSLTPSRERKAVQIILETRGKLVKEDKNLVLEAAFYAPTAGVGLSTIYDIYNDMKVLMPLLEEDIKNIKEILDRYGLKVIIR